MGLRLRGCLQGHRCVVQSSREVRAIAAATHTFPVIAARRGAVRSREGKEADPETAFVKGAHSHDDLAEELAESAVSSMNSGEEQLSTDLEAVVAEERGGPFVKTTAGVEFAEGTDESNTADATREPFPTT